MSAPLLDVSIPTLPSRDLDATAEFYRRLGFEQVFRIADPQGYSILRCGTLELHFFRWPELVPEANDSGCYLRVSDVDRLYGLCAGLRLPARGTPSLAGIERKFYDMREFSLVDPDGNLLRVGEPLRRSSPESGASAGAPR